MLFLWALAFALVLHEQDPLDAQSYAVQCFAKLPLRRNNLTLALHTYHAAADPVSMVPGSLERGTWCNEHMLHERLDTIEEKVIKTVEHLESEVKSLLNIISETTLNIPSVPGTEVPLIDVFDDTS